MAYDSPAIDSRRGATSPLSIGKQKVLLLLKRF
jgi:hypothetical protein